MKVSKQALQRIIREAVQSKLRQLDEAPSENESINDTLEVIASSITHEVHVHLQDSEMAFSNVCEMVGGTIDLDNALLPARLEDVEAFATKVATMALDYMREDVEKLAADVLEAFINQTTDMKGE